MSFIGSLSSPNVFNRPILAGFDVKVGNPPWDVLKPNSNEFFTEFDPVYRTYDKQTALKKQRHMLGEFRGVLELWGEYNARFKALGNWSRNVAEPFRCSTIPWERRKESCKPLGEASESRRHLC